MTAVRQFSREGSAASLGKKRIHSSSTATEPLGSRREKILNAINTIEVLREDLEETDDSPISGLESDYESGDEE